MTPQALGNGDVQNFDYYYIFIILLHEWTCAILFLKHRWITRFLISQRIITHYTFGHLKNSNNRKKKKNLYFIRISTWIICFRLWSNSHNSSAHACSCVGIRKKKMKKSHTSPEAISRRDKSHMSSRGPSVVVYECASLKALRYSSSAAQRRATRTPTIRRPKREGSKQRRAVASEISRLTYPLTLRSRAVRCIMALYTRHHRCI